MAEHTISPRTYVIVCGLLVVLTVLTVGISFIPLSGLWHIVFGLTIAVFKASLVVLFFMHVLISPRLTWLVIAIAVFWMGILLVLTLGDWSLGFVADALTSTILGLGLEREKEVRTLRAFGKLLWLQNDLINRHYQEAEVHAAIA